MRVFVGGPWDPKVATQFKDPMIELGKELARFGHDIMFGPGSGIVKYVTEGYRSIDEDVRGTVFFYLPHESEMIRTGEEMQPFADEIVKTDQDYLERIMTMFKDADAFMSIAGASGTVFEAVGMMFLKKPVIILKNVGTLGTLGPQLGGLKNYAFFASNPEEMVEVLVDLKEKVANHTFDLPWYNV